MSDIFNRDDVERKRTKVQLIEKFITNYIEKDYKIAEVGESVYIGKDFPGEFTHSNYSQGLLRTRRGRKKLYAKNQSVQEVGSLIEIATKPQWAPNRENSHKKDAKYEFYYYTTRFALYFKELNNAPEYEAVMIIRHDANGRKYLYDITGIKKVDALQLAASPKSQLSGGGNPTTGAPASKNKISQESEKSNSSKPRYEINKPRYEINNIGYHAGDLGKAESFWNMMSSVRSTGHFGTGTYFVGNEVSINNGPYSKRAHYTVDFSKYNLLKPWSYKDAMDVHDFLKGINDNIMNLPLAKTEYSTYLEDQSTIDDAVYDEDTNTINILLMREIMKDPVYINVILI